MPRTSEREIIGSMRCDRVLGMVSAVQLGAGLGGLGLALRRKLAYDVPLLHGHPDKVARDSVVMGTALSAPVTMLAAQAAGTVRVLRGDGDSDRVRRMLGALGVTMTAGYLAERLVRHRLRPSGWDTLESPVAVLGLATAVVMAILGLRR